MGTFLGIKRRLDRKSLRTRLPIYEGFGSSYDKARSAIAAMKLHFPGRRLVAVFEPHTFSWRNRATLHWYDDAFAGCDEVLVYEPASQGAGTHDQVTQDEIVARIRSGGPASDARHLLRGRRRGAGKRAERRRGRASPELRAAGRFDRGDPANVRATLANIGYLDTVFQKSPKVRAILAHSPQMRVDNQSVAA
jgi:hypothetical protein